MFLADAGDLDGGDFKEVREWREDTTALRLNRLREEARL